VGSSLCASCDAQIYGQGIVYLYNGTGAAVKITMQGRSPLELRLPANSGKLYEEIIAGPYQIAFSKGDAFPEMLGTQIDKNRLTIINIDGAACFARADMAGMYNRKKAPVRLLEVYKKQHVISIPDQIAVLPGQSMPDKRAKNTFAFQRVAAVPCDVARNDWAVEDYLQTRR
jgi:hypothetical protein